VWHPTRGLRSKIRPAVVGKRIEGTRDHLYGQAGVRMLLESERCSTQCRCRETNRASTTISFHSL